MSKGGPRGSGQSGGAGAPGLDNSCMSLTAAITGPVRRLPDRLEDLHGPWQGVVVLPLLEPLLPVPPPQTPLPAHPTLALQQTLLPQLTSPLGHVVTLLLQLLPLQVPLQQTPFPQLF